MRIRNMFKEITVSILIGFIAGGAAYIFNWLITKSVSSTIALLKFSRLFYILMPLIAALITYILFKMYLKRNDTGLGIVQVLVELEEIKTLLMKPVSVLVHIIGALTTLILGLSAGRFGPVVHLGASIGSNIGHFFNVEEDKLRLFIGCSAAAAIAGVFRMPFFGAVFVLEVLYKKQFFEFFSPILISSFTASVLSSLLGSTGVPRLDIVYNFELGLSNFPIYLLFGLFIGVVAFLYIECIELSSNFFNRFKSSGIRYFIGALIIGIISFMFPLNFEIHANTTYNLLIGSYSAKILLLIGVIKLLSTGITLGSGFLGGNFYPGVTVGASLGMYFGSIVSQITGYAEGSPLFGILGVGGIIGGYFNAPISGIVLALEFANSFSVVMPAIIVTAVSVSVVYYIYGKDIFTNTYNNIMKNLKI